MKRITLFMASIILMLTSCDKNIGNVEKLAKKFATAVNASDFMLIDETYPDARGLKSVQLVTSLNAENIEVTKSESDSIYTAAFNETQYLVVKVLGEESYQIVDSYGILNLDSCNYDLAAMLGVPVKENSDMDNAKLFDEKESPFLKWLRTEYSDAANAYLSPLGKSYWYEDWDGGFVELRQNVINNGKTVIKGEEYKVELAIYQKGKKDIILANIVMAGATIHPNETKELGLSEHFRSNYSIEGLAVRNKMDWDAKIVLNTPLTETLLKYCSFNGDEYAKYMASEK